MLAVPFLLRGHAGDQAGIGMPIPHDGQLPGIDAGRAEFLRLIVALHGGALRVGHAAAGARDVLYAHALLPFPISSAKMRSAATPAKRPLGSAEPTSELQSLMRTSAAVFCLNNT